MSSGNGERRLSQRVVGLNKQWLQNALTSSAPDTVWKYHPLAFANLSRFTNTLSDHFQNKRTCLGSFGFFVAKAGIFKPCIKGHPGKEEAKSPLSGELQGQDRRCPWVSKHQGRLRPLGVTATLHRRATREQGHAPRTFPPPPATLPALHRLSPRVPPRGQRQQAEPEPFAPGDRESRSAGSTPRCQGRPATAILSRALPTAETGEGS